MEDPGGTGDSERLAAQGRRLRLLVCHLMGAAIRTRVEPEDIVQEVYLRAVTAPGGLPAQGPAGRDDELWGLLSRIARNTVIDVARAVRSRKRQGVVQRLARSDWTRVAGDDPLARTAGPATKVAAAETQAALERAFEGLTADHRRVLGLRQFAGLSAAETGRRMGRSESAVHSLYRRALAAWEQALPADLRNETR